MELRADIVIDDHEAVHIRTNLRKADSCLHEPIIGALAAHLGFHMEPLTKASFEDQLDPRYPALTVLVRAARRDWVSHGEALVETISRLLREGRLLPMTASSEALLQELFRDHHVRIQVNFGGHTTDKKRLDRMVQRGLIDPDHAEKAHIPVSYRLGRGLEMLNVHRVKPTKAAPSIATVVRRALDVELTPQDQDSMLYAQRRAALYMRRPAQSHTDAIERQLTEAEVSTIRTATATAVDKRHSAKQLERELRATLKGPALQNDFERVAVTEMAFAHSYGAYEALKQQSAAAGHKDPLVYKFVSPGACGDCKRIWGPMGNPNKYRLSVVEAREAAGGNFKKHRRDWGPVIGPVHPRCTEGPLQFYDASMIDDINATADELMAIFGEV